MKNKKFVATLLSISKLSMLGVLIPVSVYAEGMELSQIADSETSVELHSTLEVPEELVKPTDLSGLTITIPADMDLAFNKESNCFEVSNSITAYGELDESKQLEIIVGETINYVNEEGDIITGLVDFGTNGTEIWTAQELAWGIDNPDERDISIRIPKENITSGGTYSGDISISIDITDNI